MKQLEITNTYDILTIVPWRRRVKYQTMYLTGIGTYQIVPFKEETIRELQRIEPYLPEELQNKAWVNDGSEFYIFTTQTVTGATTVSIPVDLVNHDLAVTLLVINKQVIIHADNVRQLNNVYRLLKDNNIRFTID